MAGALSELSATIAKGSDSPAMSEQSKRSIEQYYAEYREHDRLSSARDQLEFERTKRIVQRFLPTPPAIVADVGGDSGPYSFWLASLGYETHLIEPSVRLVEICRNRMQSNPSQAMPRTVEVGDARSLWLDDASCNAVLMFGPLYHLTERDDRIRALRKSHRVLKAGGYAFVATITRVASFVDALCQGHLCERLGGNNQQLTRGDPQDARGTGFWHETYLIGGRAEGVYNAMREPFGLLHFPPSVSPERKMRLARGRLNLDKRDDAVRC
jgi:ubiquinone/menaquinone biosynthesis C-methylase UbiE